MAKIPKKINREIKLNELVTWLNQMWDYVASLRPLGDGISTTVKHTSKGFSISTIKKSGGAGGNGNTDTDLDYPWKIQADYTTDEDDNIVYADTCSISWKNVDSNDEYQPRWNFIWLGGKWYDFQESNDFTTSVPVEESGWVFLYCTYDIDEDKYDIVLYHGELPDTSTEDNLPEDDALYWPLAYVEVITDDEEIKTPRIHQHWLGGNIIIPAKIL